MTPATRALLASYAGKNLSREGAMWLCVHCLCEFPEGTKAYLCHDCQMSICEYCSCDNPTHDAYSVNIRFILDSKQVRARV